MVIRGIVLSCAVAAVLGIAGLSWGQEAGELFPDVKSYDEQVASPVSKPEKAIEKPKAPPAVTVDAPVKPAVKEPAKEPVKVEKKEELRWTGYRSRLMTPLMSAESQARFDTDFAPRLQGMLKANGKGAGDELWKDAEKEGTSPDLKRAVWLHALGLMIRGQSELEERAEKAKAVLPLLTEETLPVAQARADSVTELAYGALSKASDALLGIVVESQCKLAKLQVQGGFPDEAGASMKAAREAFRLMREKGSADAVAEAGAWVERATGARALSTKWAETLASKPGDPTVNTQMAVLTLSLYGDVEKAAGYAGKSDVKELKAFAAAVEKMRKDAAGPRPAALGDLLAVAGALLNVADSPAAQPFDKYSIGMLVEGKLAEVKGELTTEQAGVAKDLGTRAAVTAAKGGIRHPAYTALASLMNAGAPKAGGPAGATTDSSKLVLFVKDNGTLVKYVKPSAKQDAEALVLVRKQAKTAGEKINVKFTEIETAHCLVFTDWDASEHGWLKKNVEGAYVQTARLFDFPLTENVFPGKLPVYVFTRKEVFMDFGRATGNGTLYKEIGTFKVSDEGIGYTFMYRASPDFRLSANDCVLELGRTLAWQMTEAFIARYRTNKALPAWLTQGLAAKVSFAQFAPEMQRMAIQRFVEMKRSVGPIFTDGPHDYSSEAVAGSIVEMLMVKDSRAFMSLINKVKDGMEATAALKETYKMSYDDVEKAWMKAITGAK